MEKAPRIELCADCPLRTMFPQAAISSGSPTRLEKVGEETIPQVEYGEDGGVTLSIDNVKGPKRAEIAILQEGSDIGPAFHVREETWRSGVVQQAFENCEQPDEMRYGFLKLRKQVVCEAFRSIK